MSASRRGSTQKAVAFLACAAAVAVAGALVYSMRVELFVVPARWREVKRAMEAEDGEALQPALRDLLRAQVPGLSPDGEGDVMLRGFKPSGGGELYLVGYWREEARELFLFLFLFLLDARGRVAGGRAPVEMPERVWIDQEDFASDGWVKAVLHEPTHRFFYRPSPDGLVPHGFLLRGPAEDQSPESTLVPLSTAVSIPARIWLLRDRRPPPSPERARKLLSGRRAIDLYRGLEEAERLGPAGAALALPLLEHPDPDLRARAAAVCGNDPERGAALRPLLEDPAKQVRLAAALALLASRDLEAGRAALTLVLRERSLLLLEGLEVDVAPYVSPAAAAELLARMQEDRRLLHPGARPVARALRGEDLRPHLDAIAAPWKEDLAVVDREDAGVLAHWLARIDEPAPDAILLEALRRAGEGAGDGDRVPVAEVLHGLLEREAPLRGDGAVEALEALEGFDLQRTLLLARRGAPGALEMILKHWEPSWEAPYLGGGSWKCTIETDPLDAPPWNDPIPWPGHLTADEPLWARHTPPAVLAAISDQVLEGPGESIFELGAWSLWQALRAQDPAVLKPLAPRLGALWRRARAIDDAPNLLTTALVKARDPALDELIAGVLGNAGRVPSPVAARRSVDEIIAGLLGNTPADPDLVAEILWALLERREPLEAIGAVEALERIAGAPGRGSAEGEEPTDEAETPADRLAWQDRVLEDPRWYRNQGPGHLRFDSALAASLLLVHWGVRGAAEGLVERLREPRCTWRLDWLWEEQTPASLLPALEALAPENPARHEARVRWLAGRRRK